MTLASGTRLGPYEITGAIGAGGMGEVYRARDTRLGREVAVKVLPEHLASDPALRERLSREARAVSSLSHPHICTLFDVGHESGVDYLVMEYLQGETLAQTLARGPLTIDEALRCGTEIAGAVAQAHSSGIVHRDLKPGNIMLTKSGAKVLDFGLAKPQLEEDATAPMPLTRTGVAVGTVKYMSPEQLQGREADARSDIYALGLILREMVPQAPPALERVIRRCLAKDPDQRLQSARDLELELRELQHSGVVPPASGKRRVAIYAGAAVIVALIAITAWVVWRRVRFGGNAPRTIAVLPFANLGVDKSREYLRLAIPDEITTILTYSPRLAVRPFSASRRLPGDIDPQQAAKQLDANAIVSGHLLDENGRLAVTLEAIDVPGDRLLWRDVFEVPSSDLITMRRELTSRIHDGLLPRLSGGGELVERSAPTKADAYTLYLRAAALSTDPQPNREALQMLEEAVRIDPNYAPAWAALSERSYYDYEYARAGEPALTLVKEAAGRALALDPNLVRASVQLIVTRTEDGQAIDAARDAEDLIRRRPESAQAHFVHAYALHYGGAMEQAADECNKAWSLDPGNRGFRACGTVFIHLGQYDRALQFINADRGTAWSSRVGAQVLLYQGKYDEAARITPPGPSRNLLAAWRSNAPKEQLDRAVASVWDMRKTAHDPEPFYALAAIVSLVGRPEDALEMLNASVKGGYCGYPQVDTNPLLAPVRALPGYARYHEQAKACHERFMAALGR